ncbi:MAG TPA: hypothetical protein VNB49_16425, partial [Candidatus Dormibacteraeota bacterium]|nr:hypothetical protein [Candidatus Dormibacteraeota bacterium]
WAGSGVSKTRLAVGVISEEDKERIVAAAGCCFAASGKDPSEITVSRMVPRTGTKLTLHLQPAHFITLSAPLVWIHCRGPASRSQEDYTHLTHATQFEIFMVSIGFYDTKVDSSRGRLLEEGFPILST